jgi:hypothetical protein
LDPQQSLAQVEDQVVPGVLDQRLRDVNAQLGRGSGDRHFRHVALVIGVATPHAWIVARKV